MSNKKKEERPRRNLAQYGLFDIPSELSFDGDADGLEENDSDLEAELLAITRGVNPRPRIKPKKNLVPDVDLDTLVASSMKDFGSDDELSGDENDPDLLNELKDLTLDEEPVEPEQKEVESQPTDTRTLLEERLKMYITAEENAKKVGETSRARRFNRGIKTLKDLIKQANAGKQINNEDIPPEVSVNPSNRPTPEASVSTTSEASSMKISSMEISESVSNPSQETLSEDSESISVNQELLSMLQQRREEYKLAALRLKKSGETSLAVKYMKIVKQFDVVVKAVESGQPVDLSQMPGPPDEAPKEKEESEVQGNVEVPVQEEEVSVEEQLISAGSVEEALEQRLQVYKNQEEAAKNEGNTSKARRMGRIVKQYEQAIKLNKAGKPIPVDELPTPPGYAPIPVNPPSISSTTPAPTPEKSSESITDPPPKPIPPKPLPRGNSTRKMGNQISNTHLEKQVALLLARQKEFREAALQAKRKGEIAQAKELLRTAKGFDKVIDAARGGFPIDMDSLPIPASARSVLEESFEVVLAEECKEGDTDTLEMLTRLEEQLTKQLKMCLSTRDHHKALGDVTGVNRFENLALAVTRDLDIVRLAFRTGDAIPKFHYENKSFSIVKCCTDLNDNEVEVTILRGININCANPKDVDTYVKLEFPYPQDEFYKERTAVVKDTNNPEYNATFVIPIQRNSRAYLRVFKRHALKLEVYSRGCCISDWASCFSGFFRSDQLLGSVAIKLQPLETQCELHDSFDLMDGRKKVGGKLEVRIRVRHPLVARQVEQLNEKWLVLNH